MHLRGLLLSSGLMTGSLAACLALALGSSGLARSDAQDDDDAEAKAEATAIAHQAFVENCLMCHGADMTSRQRLTPKQWTAEVEKMIGWGSPLPLERKDGLIAWLSETYPHTRPTPPVDRITPAEALAADRQDGVESDPPGITADPTRGAALFTQHCTVCHGAAARGGEIGVNLVSKPVLVRVDDFHNLLKQGRRRMPSFAAVLDDRARADLLAFLRRAR